MMADPVKKKTTKVIPPPRNKRIDLDVMSLMMTDFKVELIDEDKMDAFFVEFHGPKDSDYEGGLWKVKVLLTEEYPFKSPTVHFVNKIFHPNIDEESGIVCLNVLQSNWSSMFNLVNVFEMFLPQLLLYPNPDHPLNLKAGDLLLKNKPAYVKTVKDYVERYAKPPPPTAPAPANETREEDDDDDTDDGRSDDADDADEGGSHDTTTEASEGVVVGSLLNTNVKI